ncbi:hypothetical protein [Kribbella sp. NPDC050459]|uniref:hypothetical protein n=1 Tax=Kribbella sp. NPDC050459 TaxID=3155785 RepID=UPI0033DE1601
MRHGWEGVVLKLFRAKDFTFTVTGAEHVTERYRRVHFTDGNLRAVPRPQLVEQVKAGA